MTQREHTPASHKSAVALAPELDRLSPRAKRAWTEEMAVSALDSGRYHVTGQTGVYEIDLESGDCSCPDHIYRNELCKHLRRVAVEVTMGRLPAPNQRAVTCMACHERHFVHSSDPAVCESCQFTKETPVRDRETGDLLVVVEQTGERADCVSIVTRDGRTSIADYPTNRAYPHGDPVVWCIYPFSGESEQRYAFPHSRLVREWRPHRERNRKTDLSITQAIEA